MNDQGDDLPDMPGPAEEGVRLIGPDEAAKAAERGDVAERLPGESPRFGDRPRDIVAGSPSISFPLAGNVDPSSIQRPTPKGSLFARKAEADAAQAPLPPPKAPRVDLPPPTGEAGEQLPHWADPPPPRANKGGQGSQDQGWASYPGSQPRWKDQASDWDDSDVRDIAQDETAAIPRPSAEPVSAQRGVPAGREPRSGTSGAQRPTGAQRPAGAQRPLSVPGAGTQRGDGRDVQTAAIVGVVLAGTFLLLVWKAPFLAMLMITGIMVMAASELYAATRKPGFNPPAVLGLAAVGGMPIAAYWRGEPAITLVLVLTVVAGLLWYIVGITSERPVANLAVMLLGVAWIGVMGSFAALMLRSQTPDGGGMVVAAVLLAVAHDVGGFFGGRQFGKTPLSSVSPNKTMEGLAAGIVSSILAACLIVFVFGISPFGDKFTHALLLGMAVGVMAPIGDLAESMVKRDLRVKDMGSVLPEHGGFLDRCDAILFALPTTWYMALLLAG